MQQKIVGFFAILFYMAAWYCSQRHEYMVVPGGMLQNIVQIFKRFGDVLDFASSFWFPVQEQWTTDQRPSLEARP